MTSVDRPFGLTPDSAPLNRVPFPGPLASPEAIETYKRWREEEDARQRLREGEEAQNPPVEPPTRSLFDMISDAFKMGEQAGRERELDRIQALLAQEGEQTIRPSASVGPIPSVPENDDAMLAKSPTSELGSRDAGKPDNQPHKPVQAERDADEIIARMKNRDLTQRAAKKSLNEQWRREGIPSKTRANRLYEGSKLVGRRFRPKDH
jgi:hypothetical protein